MSRTRGNEEGIVDNSDRSHWITNPGLNVNDKLEKLLKLCGLNFSNHP